MCIIFLAYKVHPEFPLILAANRDEFYDRPTAPAHYWKESPDILAGKDLVHGGTWLGVTKRGRFAAVTNYRDPSGAKGIVSRGNLVSDFLKGNENVDIYLNEVEKKAANFSGFNLLVGEINEQKAETGYFSNRGEGVKILRNGIYGLSNHLLNTPWHKVKSGKTAFEKLLGEKDFNKESLFDLLRNKNLAADEDLPDTGIGYEREKLISPIFIETPVYGTRSSTVVTIDDNFKIDFEERVFR